MSAHRPPVAKRPDVPSASCLLCDRLALSTATARKSAEGPPGATYMPVQYGYLGTKLWDATWRSTLHALPIQSYRASPFKVRSPNLAMGVLFDFPERFDVGLTSRSAHAVVNPNWRRCRINQRMPTTRLRSKSVGQGGGQWGRGC